MNKSVQKRAAVVAERRTAIRVDFKLVVVSCLKRKWFRVFNSNSGVVLQVQKVLLSPQIFFLHCAVN